MKIIAPAPLKKGDVIGIVAPSSPPPSDLLGKGVRYLERLGFRVEIGYHLYQQYGYLAGHDRERVSDLHRMFGHPGIKAIFCARGGYGSARLLSLLDFAMIRKNPKILVGYSDITALQSALFERCGLITFTGPMVAVDFAGQFSGKSEELFWRTLMSTKRLPGLKLKPVIRQRGRIPVPVGRLTGGNLSVFASLAGTPYFPSSRDLIHLFEDIDERPYRIDRLLHQLRLAGTFERSRGILLGEFTNCVAESGKPSLTLADVFSEAFGDGTLPVMGNLTYGHTRNTKTIPLGVTVRLDQAKRSLDFLEPALSA